MLLMVGKIKRGGIFHSIFRYERANNKHMKDYIKKTIVIYSIFGGKQFIWLDNVTKASSKKF